MVLYRSRIEAFLKNGLPHIEHRHKMIRTFFQHLVFFFLVSSCGNSSVSVGDDLFSLELHAVNQETIRLSEIKKHKASAFFFLSPDCPLSQKYSLPIKSIFSKYSSDRVAVYLVFPGTLYKTEEVNKFLMEYDLPFTAIADTDKKLTDNLQATVTPEVFLLDDQGHILYQGAIDNWFAAVGQQRQVITEHYLEDALDSFLSGGVVKTSKTNAVGCIIE